MKLIEQQLAAALLPLVDSRAYPVALPQNTQYPAITFHRVEAQETEEDYRLSPLKQRRARGLKSLFQVVVWSKSYSDCARLLRECKQTLETLDGLYLDSSADGYEHELQLYTCVMEFVTWCDLDTTETTRTASGELAQVVAAMVGEIQQQLPESDVAQYNPMDRQLVAPAIRIDISGHKPGSDNGDGRLPACCEFVAWCSYGSQGFQAAEAAARLTEFIRYTHWQLGAKVTHPDNIKAEPAQFRPGKAGFESWLVSWEQTVYLGSTEADDGILPDTVLVGIDPEIGADHEDKYERL